MPETKAYSHSQGLGFCGKVQAGQRLDGRGMRNRAQLTQSHRCKDILTRSSYTEESALVKEDDGTMASCSVSLIQHHGRKLCLTLFSGVTLMQWRLNTEMACNKARKLIPIMYVCQLAQLSGKDLKQEETASQKQLVKLRCYQLLHFYFYFFLQCFVQIKPKVDCRQIDVTV